MNKKRSVKKYGRKKSTEPKRKSSRHKISRRKSVDKRKKSVSKRKKSLKRKSVKRRKSDGMDPDKKGDESSFLSPIRPSKLDKRYDDSDSDTTKSSSLDLKLYSPISPISDVKSDDSFDSLYAAFDDIEIGEDHHEVIGLEENCKKRKRGDSDDDSTPVKQEDAKKIKLETKTSDEKP
jgi:hypothetical protein